MVEGLFRRFDFSVKICFFDFFPAEFSLQGHYWVVRPICSSRKFIYGSYGPISPGPKSIYGSQGP